MGCHDACSFPVRNRSSGADGLIRHCFSLFLLLVIPLILPSLTLVHHSYDRYWTGRSAWSDIMRNARTFTRLVWFHVPLRLSPRTDAETAAEARGERLQMRPRKEVGVVMREKRMALDLVDGFVVALKHHLRSELGIYYEDLYDLVKPFHEVCVTVSVALFLLRMSIRILTSANSTPTDGITT